MSLKRNFENIGREGEALAALAAIRDHFGEAYLSLKDSKKPLSMLWHRVDHLATIELFTFGTCLQAVARDHAGWLKSTVREIKKNPRKAPGLCREILYIGMLDPKHSKLVPAPKKNPGYDFSLEEPSGRVQYFSIKGMDASDAQSSFQAGCRRVRSKWIEKLRLTGQSLALRVVSEKYLEDEDFNLIIEAIKEARVITEGTRVSPSEGIRLLVAGLPFDGEVAQTMVSDAVLIYSPPHASEHRRYGKRLREAVDNLYEHTKHNAEVLRVLIIRLHVHADLLAIEGEAKKLVEEDDARVDCVIVHQPSYTRTLKNESSLAHCFRFGANVGYGLSLKSFGVLGWNIPVGSLSSEPSVIRVMDRMGGNPSHDLEPVDYVFQQGDIYRTMAFDEMVYLSSPAAGIKTHAVFRNQKGDMILSEKNVSYSDELLLI